MWGSSQGLDWIFQISCSIRAQNSEPNVLCSSSAGALHCLQGARGPKRTRAPSPGQALPLFWVAVCPNGLPRRLAQREKDTVYCAKTQKGKNPPCRPASLACWYCGTGWSPTPETLDLPICACRKLRILDDRPTLFDSDFLSFLPIQRTTCLSVSTGQYLCIRLSAATHLFVTACSAGDTRTSVASFGRLLDIQDTFINF